MALNPITQAEERKGGKGGLFGKIGMGVGGLVGAIAGTYAGNPVGGAMAGASTGGALGGMAGNAIDPGKYVQTESLPLSRMENRPNVQLANLVDSHKALLGSNEFTLPEKEELSNSVFLPTIAKLKQNLGVA